VGALAIDDEDVACRQFGSWHRGASHPSRSSSDIDVMVISDTLTYADSYDALQAGG
jgi:hypothetical protein